MRTAKKLVMISSLAAIALTGSVWANADDANNQSMQHRPECNFNHHQKHGLEHMVHWLNLSSDQQDKVFQIMHDQEPQVYVNRKAIHENRNALRAMAINGTYDEARVRLLSEKIGSAIAANIDLRAQTNHKIYELLTPEQKRKLIDMRKKFEEKHQHTAM